MTVEQAVREMLGRALALEIDRQIIAEILRHPELYGKPGEVGCIARDGLVLAPGWRA